MVELDHVRCIGQSHIAFYLEKSTSSKFIATIMFFGLVHNNISMQLLAILPLAENTLISVWFVPKKLEILIIQPDR